ncbi:hypothetical protein [Francisella persica]|nr:hypothetical protein [Francisella persica]
MLTIGVSRSIAKTSPQCLSFTLQLLGSRLIDAGGGPILSLVNLALV